MKILSIRQPWAWAIVNGHKSIENRNWNTNFRGNFLIHAGQKPDGFEAFDFIREFMGIEIPPILETGGIVGMANITHVIHEKDEHLLTERDKEWFFGKFGFILEDQITLPFIPLKGKLGFFNLPAGIEIKS